MIPTLMSLIVAASAAPAGNASAVPAYSHIVVVVEENHDFSQIIGNAADPAYINSLAIHGAPLMSYSAIAHPSEPNYFALYAGSTFGVADDGKYSEPGPTLATILASAGKTFLCGASLIVRPQSVGIFSGRRFRWKRSQCLPGTEFCQPANYLVCHSQHQ